MSYGRGSSDKNRGREAEEEQQQPVFRRSVEVEPATLTQNGSLTAQELSIDDCLLVDPKLLFIGSKIGEGAHGKVYEGRYGDRIVAIKVLNRGSTSEERAALENRFAREVNMMSRVKHENLVKFIGACKEPLMVIVTELLPGMSLRKYLNSLRPKQLELCVAINFALDVARAMDCLHANGIIHRDLKPDLDLELQARTAGVLEGGEFLIMGPGALVDPIHCIPSLPPEIICWVDIVRLLYYQRESLCTVLHLFCHLYDHMFAEVDYNLLLTSSQKSLKLADFGLAREESVTEMMTAETGTYRWMAPELYSTVTLRQGEKKHYNNKVDVYSFGIVLWELLTNRMPFEGMSNLQAAYAAAFKQERPSIPEDIAPDLAFIIQSCWVEDPNLRPSFSQIIRMLNAFLFTLSPPPTDVPESDSHETAASSNGTMTEFSARARGKFSFLRQLFAAKRTRNSQ